ncbi:MAG: curli assembly protein CsgF [Xanthobacteraceae bacterium]|nr:curli assembly protein CsgF [Xanthobacteraceae bacterium]
MAAPACAGTLIYTPANPSFGGNPLNGSTLLSTAQAQNQHLPSTNSGGSKPLTQGQIFAQQLQSQLYASLANSITQAIFGPAAQPNGTFTFGGTTITYVTITAPDGTKEVQVTVNDGSTSTTITLPATAIGSGTN